jgi:hypothetical protein
MISKYCCVEDLTRMLLHFATLQKNGEVIEAWQNHGDLRFKANLGIERLFPREKTLMLKVLEDGPGSIEEFLLMDTYLKAIENTWAAKSDMLLHLNDSLILSLPQELHFLEKRLFERFDLSTNATHEKIEMILSLHTSVSRKPMKLQLLDLSQSGAQINVPNKILPYFYSSNLSMTVEQIGNTPLSRPVDAFVVRRLLQTNLHKKNTIQFGIKFNHVLLEQAIDQHVEGKKAA